MIGYVVGDGTSNWFLKLRQYRCSAVTGDGPAASLCCCSGPTWVAIVFGEAFSGIGWGTSTIIEILLSLELAQIFQQRRETFKNAASGGVGGDGQAVAKF